MLFLLLVFLLVLVLFLIGLHIFTRYGEYGKTVDQIPGPPALPIFGNILQVFNLSPEEVWSLARSTCKKYYPIFRMWKVIDATVATYHADHVKAIFSCKKNIKKTMALKYMKFDSRGGILSSDGPLWHHRRKIINQAFTPELLDYYSKTAIEHANNFVKELRCQSRVSILNISPEFLKLAVNITIQGTMGLDLDKVEPEENVKFRDAFSKLSEIVLYRPYITDCMFKFLPAGRLQAKTISVINNLTKKIIKERIVYREHFKHNILKNNVDNPKRDSTSDDLKEKEQCLLISDVLLQAEEKGLIDRSGIYDETSTFLLAGFETTGNQMCLILALLAENKRAQDLVRAEILKTLDPGENRLTIDNIKKLKYLERCIKESMRLLPAVPHVGRTITDSIELGKYKILPGTEVYVSLCDLHRDPNFWPEPDTFDPDRFLPENVERRHKYSFAPFGGGLRNCIGQKLAMAQMKTLTAYIIHNFILEPVDLIADQKFSIKMILTLDKHRLKFIRIDR